MDTCKAVEKKFRSFRLGSAWARQAEAATLSRACKINLQPLPAPSGAAVARQSRWKAYFFDIFETGSAPGTDIEHHPANSGSFHRCEGVGAFGQRLPADEYPVFINAAFPPVALTLI